jgi:hypothetical protein
MVSDKEHVLAAKRYAGLHKRRSGTFNLYHTDDDQEIQEDTGYHSYLAQYDHHHHDHHLQMNTMPTDTLVAKEHSFGNYDMGILEVEPMDPANIPVLTEDELEQAHDIFMFTVDRGHSEMKPDQEITPEQELILPVEDIFGIPKPSDTDLIDTSVMTDTQLDKSVTENADCTSYMKWEEADQNDEQLQSEQCMVENLDRFPSDSDNAFIHPTMDDMTQCEHDVHNGTAWDEDCLTQLPETRICIVMMDCGNGMDYLSKPEYSTEKQFRDFSDMLGANAVCKLVTHHECTNPDDFKRKMKDAIVKDVPTIIQINAMTHTDDGILTKGTWWQTNCMAANIEAVIREHKHSIKSIILNMPKASQLAYEMKETDLIPVYYLDPDAYPAVAISQQEITNILSRFYMMSSCNPENIAQHM